MSENVVADREKLLPALQPLIEWMAEHSLGSKLRCADCTCPLVEGVTRICVACGRLTPLDSAGRGEPVVFARSLTKKLFCESAQLEDPGDELPETTEQRGQTEAGSGSTSIANEENQQVSLSATGLGIEKGERISQEGSEKTVVYDERSLRKPLRIRHEEEEGQIWDSADSDDSGSLAYWAQQLALDSGRFPNEFSSADKSMSFPADESPEQGLPTNAGDFFTATTSFVEPGRSRGSGLSLAQSSELDLSYFEVSFPASGGQSQDPKVQTPEPNLSEGVIHQTLESNSNNFFQFAPIITDSSYHLNEGTGIKFGEESSSQNVGSDVYNFFRDAFGSANHLNEGPGITFLGEESSSQNIGTNVYNSFQDVSGSANHLNEGTNITFPGEESSRQNVGTGVYNFFQDASGSANRSSEADSLVACSTEEVSHQKMRKEDDSRGLNSLLNGKLPVLDRADESNTHVQIGFDDFIQSVPGSSDTFGELKRDIPAHDAVEDFNDPEGEADFDDFLQAVPRPPDQFNGSNHLGHLEESYSSQKETASFEFFPQMTPKSADWLRGDNAEVAYPSFKERYNSQNVQWDSDFFAQAGQNRDGAEPIAAETLVGQNTETDFDDFFQAAPAPANGLGVHSEVTGLDDFFKVAHKSQDKHVRVGIPGVQKGSNGKVIEQGFGGFFDFITNSFNDSHGHKVTSFAPGAADGNGGIDLNFFQAAPDQILKSGDNSPAPLGDFFHSSPSNVNGFSGQNASTGFDTVVPHSANKVLGNDDPEDFSDFFQASPSTSTSHDKKGTKDFGKSLSFNDLMQAAPKSGDNLSGAQATTELYNFFPARPESGHKSHQSLPADLFDLFHTAYGETSQAGVTPTSTWTKGRKSNVANEVSDLSVRLADHLVIAKETSINVWPFI